MSTLPASVRLSLWVTAAWAGQLSLDGALERALPDVDDVTGAVGRLQLWGDLGERLLVCALPRPGDVTSVPRGNPALAAAAADQGECVFTPTLGGAIVPALHRYGPTGDEGWQLELTAYDCDPTPTHRLESLDEAHVEHELRRQLVSSTAALEDLDIHPFAGASMREVLADRLGADRWGVPPGLPGRAMRTLQLAATVATAVSLALEDAPGLHAGAESSRRLHLQQLQAVADRALQDAATVGALTLAGLRPSRR